MSIRHLPDVPQGRPSAALRTHIAPGVLNRWDPGIRAAAEQADNVIGIYDVIGDDYMGGGFTSRRMAAALRHIGPNPVTVAINSPGGDVFEGIAMYSMLKDHPAAVTVKIMGLAASAASVIAMAGDDIRIARPGFVMIHNAWTIAIGNRHDLRDAADLIEPIDQALADLYASRTGADVADIVRMMDKEAWLGGQKAIDAGFAEDLLDSEQVATGDAHAMAAVRKVEASLRAAGMSCAEAKATISQLKSGARDAAGGAGDDPGERIERDADSDPQLAALAALRNYSRN